MGKIRVKTLGDEALEQEQKEEQKKRKEHKKVAKAPGMKGGERVVAVGPTEEELEALEQKEKADEQESPSAKVSEGQGKKQKTQKKLKANPHSQKYTV